MRFQDRNLTAPGTAEHLKGREISSGFFETLGVKLALGREFTAEEDRPGGTPAAIVSDALWRDRLGSSPSAIGKPVTLDGVDYTVIGVLPAGFHFWSDSDVYTPVGRGDPLTLRDRSVHSFLCIGRLKVGVTFLQAQAEMGVVQQHIKELYAAGARDHDVSPSGAACGLRSPDASAADGGGRCGPADRLRERGEPAAGAIGGARPGSRSARR